MRATLKRVVLENFMCYAHAEFDFYAITKITAKNGKGKSIIATAYLWCLFNCDYELKDNPVVRREIDGKSVDDMDTSVELTLDVDGKEVTMKKSRVICGGSDLIADTQEISLIWIMRCRSFQVIEKSINYEKW